MEVTKALAALQPLYGKDNVEIVTVDGQRVRGIVRSMKTTRALHSAGCLLFFPACFAYSTPFQL